MGRSSRRRNLGARSLTAAAGWATLAAAFTGIQVGATIVATRFVIGQTDPISLALMRYAIGALCLVPFAIAVRRVPWQSRDLGPIAILGIVQFAVVVVLLNYAVQTISAGRAALIFATFPLLTLLFAAALRHERLTIAKGGGVVLTILGVALTLSDKTASMYDGWQGDAAAILSAACGAACSVLYRPYLRKYDPLPVGALAMLASVAFLALLAAPGGFFVEAPALTVSAWVAVIFIGLSSGLGYWLWLWALSHTAATRVTVFLALGPVTALALGAAFLGETVSSLALAGVLCVVCGLWLAYRPETPAARPPL
jgi:drug/metabolite transporter (DMT)-like permease